ncbi:MAG TPA: hypothetical protein VLV83_02200 [Acidobacteriota bacterium]|nr:hypothetical protein [Acidobacteriota bacterium]
MTSQFSYKRSSLPNRGASGRPGPRPRSSWLRDLSDSLDRGWFFTVVFRKRTTGEIRTMRCRARVRG